MKEQLKGSVLEGFWNCLGNFIESITLMIKVKKYIQREIIVKQDQTKKDKI